MKQNLQSIQPFSIPIHSEKRGTNIRTQITNSSISIPSRILTILIILWGVSLAVQAAKQPWPKPVNYVSDFAQVIPEPQQQGLMALSKRLEEKTRVELAVVTIPGYAERGFGSIEEAAVDLFKQWGIGKKSENNGLLVLVAVKERKWRIEVGYGLEGTIPDAVASRMGRNLLPDSFRQGRYGEGLLNLSTALAAQIAHEKNIPLSELNLKSPSTQSARSVGSPKNRSTRGGNLFGSLFSLLFFFFILLPIVFFFIRHPNLFLLWLLMNNSPRRRHWDGGSHFGGFGNSGFGGGGFGGFGGGSSGGGGASGGW